MQRVYCRHWGSVTDETIAHRLQLDGVIRGRRIYSLWVEDLNEVYCL